MNRFEDEMSTNVSMLEDERATYSQRRIVNSSPAPIAETPESSDQKTNQKDLLKMGSLALKHQENTVDGLKKENFDLRLSLYFYEQRLNDLSPDNIDLTLKENVNMKVAIQKLNQELKKYKRTMLEQTQVIEMLQNKPCPKMHGMSPEEQEEYERVKAEAEEYHDENDKLSRMMADLSAENVRLRANIRSKNSSSTSSTDTNISKNSKLNRQLEDELQERKNQIHSLQLEREQNMRTLQETKQQLRNKNIECDQLSEENEDLRVNNENMDTLIENIRQLQDENDELANEIQDREQEIEALEAEVVKLLSHLEKKEGERGKNTKELDNRIMNLKEALQERDEEIDLLKNELKSLNDSHDNDIEAFEEHVAKTQEEINKKDQENKDLLVELEDSKKEFEQVLQKQYNELIVTIRDREVKLATLEGNFEAKTDTMYRERDLFQEEIQELKDRLEDVYIQLKEKDDYIAELTNMLNNKEDSEMSFIIQSEKIAEVNQKWQERVAMLENKLKNCQDKIRRDHQRANEQFNELNDTNRALKQKLVTANQKNSYLNKLLDSGKKSFETKNDKVDKCSVLDKLNRELRRELEDRERNLELERRKRKEYEDLYEKQIQTSNLLQRQLERKETMLTNSLLAHDSLKEKEELMENILYEQATGGHSFRDRTDSAMSSF